jgi:DNA-binding transcriptional regulator PaaX
MRAQRAYGITNTIINLIAAGGVLSVALIAPGATQLFKESLKPLRCFSQRQLYMAIYRLKKKKLVKEIERAGDVVWQLTPQGHKVADQQSAWFATPQPAPRWDKKWRLVIFDIPEKKKVARDVLRGKLKLWGFRQLQKSVWIWPYPCRQEVEALAESLEITPYVQVAEVSYLNHYEPLLQHFDLI